LHANRGFHGPSRVSRSLWHGGALVALLAGASGCGNGDGGEDAAAIAARRGADGAATALAGTAAARDPGREPTAAASAAWRLQETDAPVDYVSAEGGFALTWPPGCGRLRTRTPTDGPSLDAFPGTEPTMLEVLCRRWGERAEVAWVAGLYNETTERGTPPDPPLVVARVRKVLDRYEVEIVEQRPIRRGTLEGVEVRAERPGDDPGELWVRAVLAGPHFYILCAWKEHGGLFGDPDYEIFFDSFRLLAREEP
jgi:hypothetical protein